MTLPAKQINRFADNALFLWPIPKPFCLKINNLIIEKGPLFEMVWNFLH